MADNLNNPTAVLSVIATKSTKLSELVIKNGQLIFVQDKNRIALDWGGNRKFYNSIEIIEAEAEREAIVSPTNGYYFVIDSAVLWRYDNGWTQVTSKPDEVLFIGVELPELGKANKLYVNKKEQSISVWDEDTDSYLRVGEVASSVDFSSIEALF